jgi:hypothetical protein
MVILIEKAVVEKSMISGMDVLRVFWSYVGGTGKHYTDLDIGKENFLSYPSKNKHNVVRRHMLAKGYVV